MAALKWRDEPATSESAVVESGASPLPTIWIFLVSAFKNIHGMYSVKRPFYSVGSAPVIYAKGYFTDVDSERRDTGALQLLRNLVLLCPDTLVQAFRWHSILGRNKQLDVRGLGGLNEGLLCADGVPGDGRKHYIDGVLLEDGSDSSGVAGINGSDLGAGRELVCALGSRTSEDDNREVLGSEGSHDLGPKSAGTDNCE